MTTPTRKPTAPQKAVAIAPARMITKNATATVDALGAPRLALLLRSQASLVRMGRRALGLHARSREAPEGVSVGDARGKALLGTVDRGLAGGREWKLGGSAGPDCNESTMVELRDGSLLLNMRSYAGKNRRAVSISRDGGLSWSQPVLDEALIEPVCQASLIRYRKNLLLFSNPASTKRERMTVRLSRDEGKTWVAEKVLHAGPAAYSNLIELPGGVPAILYERGKQQAYEEIVFEAFSLS